MYWICEVGSHHQVLLVLSFKSLILKAANGEVYEGGGGLGGLEPPPAQYFSGGGR